MLLWAHCERRGKVTPVLRGGLGGRFTGSKGPQQGRTPPEQEASTGAEVVWGVSLCCILREARNSSEQPALLFAPSFLYALCHLSGSFTAACRQVL